MRATKLLRRLWGQRPPGRQEPMNRYLILSAGLHVLALILLSIPLAQRPRPVMAEPIYDVALVEWPEPNFKPPVPTRKVDTPKPKPKPPEPKVETPPQQDEVKIPERKKPKPEETKKPEPKKPEPKPEEKKPTEKPPEEAAPQPKVDVPDLPTEPVSLGMVDQRDFRHDWYLEQVRSRLAALWSRPQMGTGLVQSTVHFIIRKDGTVDQPFVQEPSGSSLYDRAALRAVLEAKKFAPLPEAYSGDQLGISVVFQTMGDTP